MAEISLPVVVTAISNSDQEGFVASTLFSQGWNVVYRALNAANLSSFIDSDPRASKNAVLVFATDLEGLTPEIVAKLQGKVRQCVGFSSGCEKDAAYHGLHELSRVSSELLNIIRGSVRAPLLRTASADPHRRSAKVIAVGSISPAAGCTTLSLNLAMELSALGKETLLLDADVRHPSVAALLSLHKLDGEDHARTIAPHLAVGEFTQARVANLGDYLDQLFSHCDYAVIDLGSIEGISDSLTDRRWTSSLIHWSCEQADELYLVGKGDLLGIHRVAGLVQDFRQITIHPKMSFVLNMNSRGRKGKAREELFSSAVADMRPKAIHFLPSDARLVSKSEDERATLIEIDDRSSLRKRIAEIALGLTA